MRRRTYLSECTKECEKGKSSRRTRYRKRRQYGKDRGRKLRIACVNGYSNATPAIAYDQPSSRCCKNLVPNPLAFATICSQQSQDPEPNDSQYPSCDVGRSIPADDLSGTSGDQSERCDDQSGWKHLNAGPERRRAETCLEEYWHIICPQRSTVSRTGLSDI